MFSVHSHTVARLTECFACVPMYICLAVCSSVTLANTLTNAVGHIQRISCFDKKGIFSGNFVFEFVRVGDFNEIFMIFMIFMIFKIFLCIFFRRPISFIFLKKLFRKLMTTKLDWGHDYHKMMWKCEADNVPVRYEKYNVYKDDNMIWRLVWSTLHSTFRRSRLQTIQFDGCELNWQFAEMYTHNLVQKDEIHQLSKLCDTLVVLRIFRKTPRHYCASLNLKFFRVVFFRNVWWNDVQLLM